jgi:hypothetical protein
VNGVRLTGNLRTLQALLSGNPKRIQRRVRNVVLAKTVYRPVLRAQARITRKLWS